MTEPASPTDRLADMRYDLMAERLIDALEAGVAGCPGVRLNLARGVLLQGRFIAMTAAVRLTTAVHMQGDVVPVLVRFSSSTGLPDVAENEARANPRGIAVRFFLPDGSATDLIGHSVDGFPAHTAEEFLRFLQAASRREAEPEAFERHLRENAAAARFLASIPSTPRSFAVERFSMLHGLVLKGPEGCVSIGRFHIRPPVDDHRLAPEEAVNRPSDFLTKEIIERVASSGCEMQLIFQLADAPVPTISRR